MSSLEAKRKYKAPQVNRKQLMMEESLSNKDGHMHLDNRASEFLPSRDECMKLDKRASSSANHSESFVLTSYDCDSVTNKSADKSFPIVKLACQGNLATSSYPVLQLKRETSRTFLISHNKHASESLSVLEGKTMSVDRVEISETPYLPGKLGGLFDSNSQSSGENRTIVQQEDAGENFPHNTMPPCVSTGNHCSGMAVKRRRKIIPTQSKNAAKPQDSEMKPWKYVETSISSQDGSKVSNLMPKIVEKNEEQQLQCDISHLSHYSSIAEKSMNRFVSVISSFYVSSGSRASGLRAPLKDVQNISRVRSSIE